MYLIKNKIFPFIEKRQSWENSAGIWNPIYNFEYLPIAPQSGWAKLL